MEIPNPPVQPQGRGAPEQDDPPKSGFPVDGDADDGAVTPVPEAGAGTEDVSH